MAESVDWARTLLLLHADVLDEALVRDTLNVLLKRETDIQEVQGNLGQLALAAVQAAQALSAAPASAPSSART